MDTSYLKLLSGSRLSNYLGLRMQDGVTYRYPEIQERNYSYIEVPVSHILLSTGESSRKAARNQHVRIIPACSVDVKGNYRFEVHPNIGFWEYGVVQGMYYLEPKDGELEPGFYLSLRKDLDLDTADLGYAIRIYMRA